MARRTEDKKTYYMSWRLTEEQFRIVDSIAKLLEGNYSMALRFIINDFARRHGMSDGNGLDLDLNVSSGEEDGVLHKALV